MVHCVHVQGGIGFRLDTKQHVLCGLFMSLWKSELQRERGIGARGGAGRGGGSLYSRKETHKHPS